MNAMQCWGTVREHVCSTCNDFSTAGTCTFSEGNSCALYRSFPKVLTAIRSVSGSDHPEAYHSSVRRHVCGECYNQDSRGRCVLRNNLDCMLSRSLETVARIVKEWDACWLPDSESSESARDVANVSCGGNLLRDGNGCGQGI